MLKKNKKYDNDNEFEVPKITGQRRFSMASSAETGDQRTIIGEHIFIEGDIRGEENLLLEGSIKGNIDIGRHNFIIGAKGRFEGEISAQNLGVSGHLVGNVKIQEKAKFTKEADFLGNIKAKSISQPFNDDNADIVLRAVNEELRFCHVSLPDSSQLCLVYV